MNAKPNVQSIILICDEEGMVQGVVRNDFGLRTSSKSGFDVRDLVGTDMREKVSAFVAELRAQQNAHNWEISLPRNGTTLPTHSEETGLIAQYLVKASRSDNSLTALIEQPLQICDEPSNVLAAVTKDLAQLTGQSTERDEAVYDEISAVNNEMVNLQREMAKKNEELKKLNGQKNRLLGMAAHDLRSPLGVIALYSEFLADEAALTLEQRAFVTTIKEMSQFMVGIINDVLDVATFESGQLKLNPRPADLAQLIEQNVALNRVLAVKKDIAIEFAPLVAILAFDPVKMHQVLNNLISNAVKFSYRHTKVRIGMSRVGNEVTVMVQDEGPGIPEEDLPRLFKPFSRTSVRSTAGESSNGLGLAIVRRIVEGHGGRIWVESILGLGSKFYFSLPVVVA